MSTTSQKTILFLHGYTQNASIFRAKSSALRKKLMKLGYNCVYLNAPYVLTPADLPTSSDGDSSLSKFGSVASDAEHHITYRGWWIKPNKGNDFVEIDKSFDAVKNYINKGEILPDDEEIKKENIQVKKEAENEQKKDKEATEEKQSKEVVGIIGFSQGGAFANLIAHNFNILFNTNNSLKFVILYSSFKLDTLKRAGNEKYKSYYPLGQDDLDQSSTRYLHVLGELDTVVDESRSLAIYETTKSRSDLLKHPGGHFVPNSKVYVDQVCNWIQSVTTDEVEKSKNGTNDNGVKDKTNKFAQKETKDDIDDLLAMMDGFGKA